MKFCLQNVEDFAQYLLYSKDGDDQIGKKHLYLKQS